MAIVNTIDLGWGSSITSAQFVSALGDLSDGDTLFVHQNFGISGTATASLGSRSIIIDGDHTNNAGFNRTDSTSGKWWPIRIDGAGGGTAERNAIGILFDEHFSFLRPQHLRHR